MIAKADSHLLLEEDRTKLTELLSNKALGVTEVQWDISIEDDIRRRDQFFFENGLNIHPDDVRCRWSIRYNDR